MIQVRALSKTFRVAQRQKGALAAAKGLFKRDYRYIKALEELSFQVNEGEIVGYIGPNGAGKSTTIKIMSGILTPDQGTCQLYGYTPWKQRREYVRHIGVVFGQRTQLWWDVPIIDSFDLLRDIYKIPAPLYKANLSLLTETLSLGDFLHTPLRQVSLGQRMRAEIAASLLHDPKILFLDEPTIGLDAVSKLAVRQFIKTINQEKKLTVILTTHDMNDIEALTDRLILIGKGKKLYDGSMQKIKNRFDLQRTLTLSFSPHKQPIEVPHATLESWKAEQAVYRVNLSKTTVTDVIHRLTAQVNLLDITSEACALEEVIAELYKEHGL